MRPDSMFLRTVGVLQLFDYRCVHRRGANSSHEDQHVLYFTYAQDWFVDKQNHRSAASLFDEAAMPAVHLNAADADESFETEITLGDKTHKFVVPFNGIAAAVQNFCIEHGLPQEFATELEQQLQGGLVASQVGADAEIAPLCEAVDSESADASQVARRGVKRSADSDEAPL